MSAAKTEGLLRRGRPGGRDPETVGDSDICLFAGITEDLSSNHVNEHVMEQSKFQHWWGMARCSSGSCPLGRRAWSRRSAARRSAGRQQSARIRPGRFVAPVFIGDTVTVRYRISRIESERNRSYGAVATAAWRRDGRTRLRERKAVKSRRKEVAAKSGG
jgi:3-hydroxybutyryl-CoA dehydratase